MIGMMNAPSLPPATLSDEAMKLCAVVLAVASDPAGTAQRLQQLNEATATLRAAIDEHAGVVAQANEVAARETAVATRERDVIAREQAVANAATAVDVSAAANVARSKSLDDREAELVKRIAEHEAKVAANEQRLAQVRASLACFTARNFYISDEPRGNEIKWATRRPPSVWTRHPMRRNPAVSS